MKERPILFNTEMVKAILDGRKTQTRRVMRRQPDAVERFHRGETTTNTDAQHAILRCYNNPKGFKSCNSGWSASATYKTPFSEFNVGDHLWVRESFMDLTGTGVEHRDSNGKLQRYAYMENCPRGSHSDETRKEFGLKWKPSIHMPRSASRILLEITKIRVECLTSISVEDALAEGITHKTMNCPRHEFFQLWNGVYGDMTHELNPWVWVIEFKIVEGVA